MNLKLIHITDSEYKKSSLFQEINQNGFRFWIENV